MSYAPLRCLSFTSRCSIFLSRASIRSFFTARSFSNVAIFCLRRVFSSMRSPLAMLDPSCRSAKPIEVLLTGGGWGGGATRRVGAGAGVCCWFAAEAVATEGAERLGAERCL
eukprot:XP_001704368.1 Hypothetical protein GL50803_19663 [Giardia lamblia ATCC 50803]